MAKKDRVRWIKFDGLASWQKLIKNVFMSIPEGVITPFSDIVIKINDIHDYYKFNDLMVSSGLKYTKIKEKIEDDIQYCVMYANTEIGQCFILFIKKPEWIGVYTPLPLDIIHHSWKDGIKPPGFGKFVSGYKTNSLRNQFFLDPDAHNPIPPLVPFEDNGYLSYLHPLTPNQKPPIIP